MVSDVNLIFHIQLFSSPQESTTISGMRRVTQLRALEG
jgi:hypothetical protein